MTNEFSPTCGLTRKKRRPRLTMRLHPRGGDLLADATGRESLCRHPQFASTALRAAALKWTNVVRSVRSDHSPRPHKESLRPGRDPAVAPKGPRSIPLGSAADHLQGASPAASQRPVRHPHEPRRATASGIPRDRHPIATPRRGRTLPAIPRRTTRVPSSVGNPTEPWPAPGHGLPSPGTTRRTRSPGPREPRVGFGRLPRWRPEEPSRLPQHPKVPLPADCRLGEPVACAPDLQELQKTFPDDLAALGSGTFPNCLKAPGEDRYPSPKTLITVTLPSCLAAAGSGNSGSSSIGECPSRWG
jgi:hypothetical protein